ncbi:hypothetical protein E2C01_048911 [Portunus trituberculatus]|uniref:C2CD3 N-terminal C2 domain-containing protein n=1 Tax=Portunus trituberculatus TaxID=210409 RepID=A0A5B7G4A4_PORTR|nr:hypothetical protein [Portunus trituberculatus]
MGALSCRLVECHLHSGAREEVCDPNLPAHGRQVTAVLTCVLTSSEAHSPHSSITSRHYHCVGLWRLERRGIHPTGHPRSLTQVNKPRRAGFEHCRWQEVVIMGDRSLPPKVEGHPQGRLDLIFGRPAVFPPAQPSQSFIFTFRWWGDSQPCILR